MTKPAVVLSLLILAACGAAPETDQHQAAAPGRAAEPSRPRTADRLTHITGCENGELMVPVVRLWSKPGGLAEGARPVGQLSGDGREDRGLKCQGAVVFIRDSRVVSGRQFYKVETVVGSQTGWLTDSFIGRTFDRSQCASHFKSDPAYVTKCENG